MIHHDLLFTFESNPKKSDNENDKLHNAIKYAIEIGYRHFDGAWLYGNEDVIGKAIKEAISESNGKLKREDLFLVSKVWNTHHSKDLVRKCLNDTLQKLQVDYIDLYLVHWPMGFKVSRACVFRNFIL